MAEELKIIIDADVSQAQAALSGIQDSANKTATSLKNVAPAANSAFAATAQQAKVVQLSVSTLGRTIDELKQKVAGKQALISTERDVANIAVLNKEIQALQAEILRVQNVGKAGFNALGQASTEATDKLVGGFQNAFGAIRRLAFILPGIGIAGIFDAAFQGLQKLADAVSSANLGVNKFKELTDAIAASKDEFVKASVTVSSLRDEIQLAKDGFISKDEVVKKYNETIGKTTGLVNDINQAEQALNKNAQAYIKFTLDKAAANVALGKSAELAFQAALQNQKDLERISKITADKEGIGEFIKSGEDNLRKAEQESFQKRIKSLNDIADNFLKEAATISKAFNFNFFDENKQKSAVKSLDEVQQKLIQLAKEAEKVFNVPLTLKFDDTDLSPEKLRKAIEVLQGIQAFTIKAKVDIQLPDIKELPKEQVEKFFKNIPNALQDAVDKGIIDAQGKELKIDLGPFSKEIQAEIDKFNQAGLKIPVTFDLKDADLLIKLRDAFPIEQIQKNVDELKKSLGTEDTFQGFIRDLIKLGDEGQKAFESTSRAALDAGDSIAEALRKAAEARGSVGGITKEAGEAALVLQQTLAPAFESLFSSILAGQAPLEAFFKTLIRGIDQLIAKLIAAAIEALILSSITGGVGGFGGIFKALLGFAKGGDPSPDKPFIAGEKGWELVVPKTSMHVFTHEQSKSILSSSVRQSESVKEYLIAAKVSQQLKEHFSTAFKSIETNVKTLAINNDRLATYSYKLHDNISSLKESFASVTIKSNELLSNSLSSIKETFNNSSTIANNEVQKLISNNIASLKESFVSKESGDSSITQRFSNIVSTLKESVNSNSLLKQFISTATNAEKITSLKESGTVSDNNFIEWLYNSITTSFNERFATNNTVSSFKDSFATVTGKEVYWQTSLKDRFSSYTDFEKIKDRLKETYSNDSFNTVEKFASLFKNFERSTERSFIVSTYDNITSSLKELVGKEHGAQSTSEIVNRLVDSFTSNLSTSVKEYFNSATRDGYLEKITKHFNIDSSRDNNIISFEKIASDKDHSRSVSDYVSSYATTDKDRLISIEKLQSDVASFSNKIKEINSATHSTDTVYTDHSSFEKVINYFTDRYSYIIKDINNYKERTSSTDSFAKEFYSHSFEKIASFVSFFKSESFDRINSSIKEAIKFVSTIHSIPYGKQDSISKSYESHSTNNNYHSIVSVIERHINDHHSSIASAIKESVNSLHSMMKTVNNTVERSDKTITIERIVNNNFFGGDKFKETFKSMSISDLQRTFHIPAFASGGAVFGPTLAILGEGFGVSRGNPEFVGTASQLKGIQGGQFDVNVSVDGELSFSMGKLAVALNREVRSQLRTNGKRPF